MPGSSLQLPVANLRRAKNDGNRRRYLSEQRFRSTAGQKNCLKFQLEKSRAMPQDVAYSTTATKWLNPNQLPVPSYLQRTAIKTSFVILIFAFAGIRQISAEQRSDAILIQGNPAGTQTVQTDSAGITHVEYSYNDRGVAITSPRPGSSTLLECLPNTRRTAMIT